MHLNPLDGVVHLNVTRLRKPDGEPFDLTDPEELSAAEVEGRRQAFVYEEVFRRFVPGFARARIVDIGAMVGIRETRLVLGEKTLTEGDVRGCVKPEDRIACTAWPPESHTGGRGTNREFLPDGDYYGIPYGCLAVKGLGNLLVAGRNLSATHVAQASARVAGPCFAMGEAAGIANGRRRPFRAGRAAAGRAGAPGSDTRAASLLRLADDSLLLLPRRRLLHHRDRRRPVLVAVEVDLHLLGRQPVTGRDELLEPVVAHPQPHLEWREARDVRPPRPLSSSKWLC